MRKIFLLTLVFSILLLLGLFVKVPSISAASVYLSPASGAVQIGNNLSMDIRLSTEGKSVTSVSLRAAFDTNQFDESQSSYSVSGSSLSQTLFMSLNNGIFSIQQFCPIETDPSGNPIPPVPVSGDVLLGKLTLKAAAGSGSANVSFVHTGDNGTVAFESPSGEPLATTSTSGTYSLTSPSQPPPPPPPPPPSGGSTKPPTSSSSPSSPTSTGEETVNVTNTVGDTTAPTISNIKVSDITNTSIVVSWTTDEPSTSYIDFGETLNYGSGNGDANYTKDHKITIANGLKATTEYNFRVFSSDQAGNTAYGKNQTFTTKPPVSVQRTYRFIGLAMIIGGISALAVIAFFYFRKKGPHPDNLEPQEPSGPVANLNPPI